jgi:hypothetical protein
LAIRVPGSERKQRLDDGGDRIVEGVLDLPS